MQLVWLSITPISRCLKKRRQRKAQSVFCAFVGNHHSVLHINLSECKIYVATNLISIDTNDVTNPVLILCQSSLVTDYVQRQN